MDNLLGRRTDMFFMNPGTRYDVKYSANVDCEHRIILLYLISEKKR